MKVATFQTRRVPHTCPNADLSNFTGPVNVDWPEWRGLYGGGFGQWIRWFFTFGYVPIPDHAALAHERFIQDRTCHRFDGRSYCFCDERPPHPDPETGISVGVWP